jgi:Tfp pilus assembly protein PilF
LERSPFCLLALSLAIALEIFSCSAPAQADAPPSLYVKKGFEYLDGEKIQKALECANLAVKAAPRDKLARLLRGATYSKFFQPKDAIKDLDVAIEIDPKYSAAYLWRGTAYSQLEQWDKAVEQFSLAIENGAQHDPSCYKRRGEAYEAMGKIDLALKDFGKNIELRGRPAPSHDAHRKNYGREKWEQAYALRAKVYFNSKKYQLALDDLKKGVEVGPFSDSVHLLMADCHLKLNQPELAVKDYATIIAANPADDEAYEKKARLLLSMKKFNEALKDASAAIENYLGENPARLYKLRAEIYSKLGKNNLAQEDLKKASSY